MNLCNFRYDRNLKPYGMKKCKYHCDYGDGENCHYKEENGCIYNENKGEEQVIIDKREHLYVVVKNGMYMQRYAKGEARWVTKRSKNIWGTYDKEWAEKFAKISGGYVEEWKDELI